MLIFDIHIDFETKHTLILFVVKKINYTSEWNETKHTLYYFTNQFYV